MILKVKIQVSNASELGALQMQIRNTLQKYGKLPVWEYELDPADVVEEKL